MRKLMIAGLIAATLAPAMASAQNQDYRDNRRDVRQEQRQYDRQEQRQYDRGARPGVGREDWRDYRGRHPEIYRGARYVGPRGYAYRPVSVGYQFQPSYYDRRYWIDASRYRLPIVGGNERWVRYDRDVVRIDLRSGRVLQVYGGFFY
ncbi:RcnB family protein [Sphingomonas bacterium]|uniref:RcnB family protein n=1 Tax=Sphingomonas bacterium TaxID=1895847 RepID=UPI0015773724|nr:RcnB family protein [Sphingomonas bacterium]